MLGISQAQSHWAPVKEKINNAVKRSKNTQEGNHLQHNKSGLMALLQIALWTFGKGPGSCSLQATLKTVSVKIAVKARHMSRQTKQLFNTVNKKKCFVTWAERNH